MWIAYNILFAIGFVLMLPRFLLRMRRRGGYRDRFAQRFGRYEPALRAQLAASPRLWIHAVSVGEMYVALQFIESFRLQEPGARFVITTVTSTGRALALAKANAADLVLYFPLDFPLFVTRALNAIQPRMLILTEGELWPNILRQCRTRGIPVVVINGRMTEKSARGYTLLGPLSRVVMGYLDSVFVQSVADRRRYLALGADPARVEVLGSVKYDIEADPDAARRAECVFKQAGWGPGAQILLGGSTWPGEEGALAETVKRLRVNHPELRLVLVPRHAERAKAVAEELDRVGLRVLRRSTLGDSVAASPPEVLLVDTTGELKSFYAAAHVVFVGKSLFGNRGGQNFIEPAVFGKPILVGPHLENFPGVAEDFFEAGALLQIVDADTLSNQVGRLLRDPVARTDLGRRAFDLVTRRRGVMNTTVARLRAQLKGPV